MYAKVKTPVYRKTGKPLYVKTIPSWVTPVCRGLRPSSRVAAREGGKDVTKVWGSGDERGRGVGALGAGRRQCDLASGFFILSLNSYLYARGSTKMGTDFHPIPWFHE
ncbi:hypothetical protein TREMEDRAFT_58465 [Tremella mesenterica DSM 1558]|uniref:uncharacterized protein n=1 Tax=Tremella mesenterica (strain ATCC 24925 / CBS 8224 / DSM 1558 / NBRC 9311 / NRRL Y-6157 / RJB 2259-6 / UBC 559-6) TaxID=578456 RepID=UPI0003F49C99|nr:uncharacterized protein TREMEDRAFT_58465 [Tremella mesenterica DSM 1558]EIW72302.1 hypothetical protein TREMEDRAFT_58465 [Tremella mesenterica DSM 1558]